MNNTASDKSGSVFRTSLSGFNKEDVNNYIIRMNKEFREKEADYKDELENIRGDADKKVADALTEIEKLKDEIITLKASADIDKSILDSMVSKAESRADRAEAYAESAKKLEIENKLLKAKCEALELNLEEARNSDDDDIVLVSDEVYDITTRYEDEIKTLKRTLREDTEKISACEKIISEQRELIDAIKDERDSLITAKAGAEETSKLLSEQIRAMTADNSEKDEAVEKSQLYDQISRQVGDILINASKTSDEIIDRANVRAGEIIGDAENAAENRKKFIEDTADEILRRFRKEMNFASEQCFAEISASLNGIQNDASEMLSSMEKRNRELSEKILDCKSNLADSLKENLRVLDKKIMSGDSTKL